MEPSVLITGTSRGIGEALAGEYLSRGWQVLGVSRRENQLLNAHDRFQFMRLDLVDHEQVSNRLGEWFREIDSLDGVILNAGMLGQIRDMADVPLGDLRQIMDVNLWANKTVLDAVFSGVKQVSQVVSISSGAAVNGNRGWNGYSLSKAALNMLTMLYAREQPDTHFCALAPGLVDTAMQDYLCGLDSDDRFAAVEKIKAARSTEDMPTPSQVAGRLVNVILALPEYVESGSFADVRQLDFQAN